MLGAVAVAGLRVAVTRRRADMLKQGLIVKVCDPGVCGFRAFIGKGEGWAEKRGDSGAEVSVSLPSPR